MPEISVIIPAYGRQESLDRAAASVMSELGTGDELIIVDDGSAPPIALDAAIATDRRLCLIRLDENQGAAAARNVGIAASTRPLVAFLDSDDVWRPGKLAAQRALFDGGAELMAASCAWIDTRNGKAVRTRLPRPSRSRADFFAGCWFAPGSTLMISRAAFEACGVFREDLLRLEDYEWFVRFALAGGRLVTAPVTGAAIAAGSNARLEPVARASALVQCAHASDARVSPLERRRMTAFLALARASAARNEGNPLLFLVELTRSIAAAPRLRPHLEDWWQVYDGVYETAKARNR